jgi:predicted nuclease of predicted toxin-antitoxin system
VPVELAPSLRELGIDVETAAEANLCGQSDTEVLQHARLTDRVVVTQDPDFGALAIRQGERCRGVILLRPGHLEPAIILDTLRRLFAELPPVEPPFLMTVTDAGSFFTSGPATSPDARVSDEPRSEPGPASGDSWAAHAECRCPARASQHTMRARLPPH